MHALPRKQAITASTSTAGAACGADAKVVAGAGGLGTQPRGVAGRKVRRDGSTYPSSAIGPLAGVGGAAGAARSGGLGSKRTENLCKPSPTSICGAVAQLLSSATATVPQAGRAFFCRRYMSHKAEAPRQVARHGLA